MSPSFCFRDYVYKPLGGSRAGDLTTVRNLWIVFLLVGAWHGIAWKLSSISGSDPYAIGLNSIEDPKP